jgi:hypothetical protein
MIPKELKILFRHGKQYIPDLGKVELTPLFRGRPVISSDITKDEAEKAAALAANNPFLRKESLRNSRHILVSITGGDNLTLSEIKQVMQTVESTLAAKAEARPEIEAFWLEQFKTVPALPELPVDRPRPTRRSSSRRFS